MKNVGLLTASANLFPTNEQRPILLCCVRTTNPSVLNICPAGVPGTLVG